MTFYELPRTRHMPSAAWSDLLVETLFDDQPAGVDQQINDWIGKDQDETNLLAFTPPACTVDADGPIWYATLIYQQKVDPNGGQDGAE